MSSKWLLGLMLSSSLLFTPDWAVAEEAATPAVGGSAPNFELQAVAGALQGKVALADALKKGPVVLVVLRGFPGYQCPICSRQVGALVSKAADFRKANASVLMVYPGPAAELEERATEFLKGSELPQPLTLLLDPDYEFTNAYHLRWDAPRETAYPSTFVIDQAGNVRMAKVSQTHGDRADVAAVLQSLSELER